MQKEYCVNYFRHRITLNPSAGDIVVAKSHVDSIWYRGRIMEEKENDEFTGNWNLIIYYLTISVICICKTVTTILYVL